ncbi:hypothetical protein llap_7969 [Limosa lapponica baueri]|uniref:Uncharacterized protein n=1 Tax=Limosa lapponica baueri TaxID=1758121 RepID=A0A2I0U6J8_LIMLA|nr:hypothetical protein llap_7969 [Limosa lapponica baueri]
MATRNRKGGENFAISSLKIGSRIRCNYETGDSDVVSLRMVLRTDSKFAAPLILVAYNLRDLMKYKQAIPVKCGIFFGILTVEKLLRINKSILLALALAILLTIQICHKRKGATGPATLISGLIKISHLKKKKGKKKKLEKEKKRKKKRKKGNNIWNVPKYPCRKKKKKKKKKFQPCKKKKKKKKAFLKHNKRGFSGTRVMLKSGLTVLLAALMAEIMYIQGKRRPWKNWEQRSLRVNISS